MWPTIYLNGSYKDKPENFFALFVSDPEKIRYTCILSKNICSFITFDSLMGSNLLQINRERAENSVIYSKWFYFLNKMQLFRVIWLDHMACVHIESGLYFKSNGRIPKTVLRFEIRHILIPNWTLTIFRPWGRIVLGLYSWKAIQLHIICKSATAINLIFQKIRIYKLIHLRSILKLLFLV